MARGLARKEEAFQFQPALVPACIELMAGLGRTLTGLSRPTASVTAKSSAGVSSGARLGGNGWMDACLAQSKCVGCKTFEHRLSLKDRYKGCMRAALERHLTRPFS
jgi:hypothetical protein